MKTTIRWLLRAIALVLLLLAAGTILPRPLWPGLAEAGAPGTVRRILVLSNPIHTDIAIPLDEEIRRRFGFLNDAGVPVDHSGATYLILGWGGRSFYLETPQWSDLRPLPVLKALTIDRSVMHANIAGNLSPGDPAITELTVDESGYQRMVAFMLASFSRAEGQPIGIPGAGYGRYDAFFEANGHFNALVGCNTWTARALREAGLTTGLWNPVPQTLALSLALHN